MANALDYVDWRGDLSFDTVPVSLMHFACERLSPSSQPRTVTVTGSPNGDEMPAVSRVPGVSPRSSSRLRRAPEIRIDSIYPLSPGASLSAVVVIYSPFHRRNGKIIFPRAPLVNINAVTRIIIDLSRRKWYY